MKFFFDLFPVIVFFVVYKMVDIYAATAAAIAASFIQVGWHWLRHRQFEKAHLIGLVLIVVFGGMTLILRDAVFIMWKPTVLYWLFALVFLVTQFVGERTLAQRMLGQAMQLPRATWIRLNLAWAGFFVVMGILNLAVAMNFSEDFWVNFKLFGFTGLTLAFVFGQFLLLNRHLVTAEEKES